VEAVGAERNFRQLTAKQLLALVDGVELGAQLADGVRRIPCGRTTRRLGDFNSSARVVNQNLAQGT
jgi:hypothetical protein